MFLSLSVLIAVVALSYADPMPSSCGGAANNHPVYSGKLEKQKAVPNGVLYTYGPKNFTPPLLVAHVTGDAYEMGQATGALLRDQIHTMVPETWAYMEEQINSSFAWLPEPVRTAVEKFGLEFALNLTIDLTRPHTPQHFVDFFAGMGNGTGLPMHTLWQVSMIPELIKASCTIMTGWGKATKDSDKPGMTQARLLDWGTDGPFQQFPLTLCYHPTSGGNDDDENGSAGHTFCSQGWAGLVGAITGLSSSGIGVQEKVWIASTSFERMDGYPFHFLMQDILQYDECMDDALSRVGSANRTCSIFLGVGSSEESMGKVIHYASEYVNIYNPKNYPTDGDHPRFDDLVYVDKHVQPSSHQCLPALMQQFYGKIDGPTAIQVAAMEASGNMHAAIYDWGSRTFYISNASPTQDGPVVPAYERQFLSLDMDTQLFDATLAHA